VRDFIIKYQDRLLYGTDIGIRGDGDPGWSAERAQHILEQTWLNDWHYFTTDQMFTQNDKVTGYQGLDLPLSVLENIYYKNAEKMYTLSF
jgi:predicted TIM-barrel fold metal-dependent hydrolase